MSHTIVHHNPGQHHACKPNISWVNAREGGGISEGCSAVDAGGFGEQHGTQVRWKPQVAKFLQVTTKQSLYNHISSHQPTLKSPRKL